MVHTPGSHLLTTNQTQIISKTRTHRSQQSILLQLFFATQCYTSGSEIWDLHAKLGLFGTKFGLWSHLGPSPKFGNSLERLINSYTTLGIEPGTYSYIAASSRILLLLPAQVLAHPCLYILYTLT